MPRRAAPNVSFPVRIRSCSRSKKAGGYSTRDWNTDYYVGVSLWTDAKRAGFSPGDAAYFVSGESAFREGWKIGDIELTMEQFDVPTLAHECLHAVHHWAEVYRPKDITALCAEEMLCYGLANLISDCLSVFERKGLAIMAE